MMTYHYLNYKFLLLMTEEQSWAKAFRRLLLLWTGLFGGKQIQGPLHDGYIDWWFLICERILKDERELSSKIHKTQPILINHMSPWVNVLLELSCRLHLYVVS